MAEMITRCPHCDTAFRVTAVHLQSARGSVRCGSCLQVFNAKEHLVLASSVSTKGNSLRREDDKRNTSTSDDIHSPPAPPQQHDHAEHDVPPVTDAEHEDSELDQDVDFDEVLISDDMDMDELVDDIDSAFDGDVDVYRDEPPEQAYLFELTDDDQEDDFTEEDESWALRLLEEDAEEPATESSSNANAETKPFDTPDTETRLDLTPDDELESAHDDSQALEIDADEPRERLNDQQPETAELPAIPSSDQEADDNSGGFSEDSVSEPPPADFEELEAVPKEAGSAFTPPPLATPRPVHDFDSGNRHFLDAIEPEPVEFAVKPDASRWRRRLLWSALSMIALLTLAGQAAWLQYPNLSRTEPYRTYYGWACELIGCTLPVQRDLGAIRTSNLVVRSHPQEPQALMVDVMVQNTAPFPQPFPLLEITFSDLNSQVVAQRRFSSAEYLGGELAGQTAMPVRQPVHIAIEIVDPGPQAVNYQIRVVEPAHRR